MYLLFLWSGKIIQKATRLFHNSGAALPGLFIERFMPGFLGRALKKLPQGVVVISGTNGKTTTTKIVADTLRMLGMRVLTNRSGSNMTRGLISMIVSESKAFGRLPYDIAVLEVDEAYAPILAKKVSIRAAVVLNVMRDQLDRFGEIDSTARYLGELTNTVTETIVLNANDGRVAKLPSDNGARRVYFSTSQDLSREVMNDDERHGGGKPTNTKADVILTSSNVYDIGINGLNAVTAKLEGVHNHLNMTAAFGLIANIGLNIDHSDLLVLMSNVEPAFGRGERVILGDSIFDIQLVKNPGSFSQTVRASKLGLYETVTVVLNDAYADGRDVSWVWDADMENLSGAKCLYAAGTRRYDIALRLKYAGLRVGKIFDGEKAMISSLQKTPGMHVIFCTYTAMMSLRKQLVRSGHAERIK